MPSNIARKTCACLFAAMLATANAAALAEPAAAPQNVAQLSATGTVEVQQDLLAISLSTTREGADAAAVQAQLTAAVFAALTEARKTAQPGQMEVRSGAFSLYPRQSKEGRISTWQGRAEIVLEGRDFARISAAAGRVQGLTVGAIEFGLSREERARAEAEARAQAIERFKAKAGEVAQGFGFAGYGLREVAVQVDDVGMPVRPRMMAMQAAPGMADKAVPVEAGKSTVTVTVSGSVQMR